MSISKNQSAKTSELIKKLEIILRPNGEDLVILDNRKDSKFSQKVRNLKAHDTFEKYGDLAIYDRKTGFTITKSGLNLLSQNFDFLRSIISNDFQWDDTKDVLDQFALAVKKKRHFSYFDEDTLVREGYKKQISASIYERSKKLRDAAFDFYRSKDGHIECNTCSFDFKSFYGNIGSDFIELHHVKPVFMYEDEDLNKKIQNAIQNIIPVCSNCHRMIHRNWNKPVEIKFLIQQVKTYGKHNQKIV